MSEGSAWRWLLSLERLDWEQVPWRQREQQIQIRVIPGKLYATSGAPLVKVSVTVPQLNGKRVRGTGNSLATACQNLYFHLCKAGVQIESPQVFEIKEQIAEAQIGGVIAKL